MVYFDSNYNMSNKTSMRRMYEYNPTCLCNRTIPFLNAKGGMIDNLALFQESQCW